MATVAGFVRWLKTLRSLNAQRQALLEHATELGRLSARIDPLVDGLQTHAQALGARERELRVLEAKLGALESATQAMNETLAQRTADLGARLDQRERDVAALTARVSALATRIDQEGVAGNAVREGVRREITAITAWLGRLDHAAAQLVQADRDAAERVEADARDVTRRVEAVRDRLEAIAPSFPTLPDLGPEHGAAWFHAAVEGAFRGPEAEIRKRLSAYLPYVIGLPREIAALPALDIGSGRGEWLRELSDAGVTAVGVDTNAVSVERCASEGLNVVREDAIAYLRRQPEASLGVVSAFHVIEHLPTESLIALLIEARRALAPGGLLLLETPNPDNVLVGSSSFYLDPTHRHPVPAPLLRVIVEFAKFDIVEPLALQPNDELRELAQAERWPPTLARLLAGPQDIGIVARKPDIHRVGSRE
jgi:O-antigen chain-terminating methyltransferase